MAQHWRVVGGGDKGGIVVRDGQSLKSTELGRLRTQSVVEERELVGDRLRFQLVSGDGPAAGWVSLKLKDNDLLDRLQAGTLAAPRAPEEPRPAAEEATATARHDASGDGAQGAAVVPAALAEGAAAGVAEDAAQVDLEAAAREAEAFWAAPARRKVVPADASVLQRFLAGEDAGPRAERLGEPRDYKGGQLPVMPRTIGLPTYAALPDKMKKSFPERATRKPMIRLYCFPGAADNYMLWVEFATAAPEWCEVAVYEPRAHGFRPDEPWDRTLEERAADAFQVMRPAFATHARGGVSEGAPFGFLSHGVGGQLVALLAQRLKRELSLEPLVVFANDGPPPNCPTLSPAGYRMLCDDVHGFYRRFQPDTMRQYDKLGKGTKAAEQLVQKWSRGLRLFEEHAYRCLTLEEPVYHKFRCDFHVLVAKHTQDIEDQLGNFPAEFQKEYNSRKNLTASPPEKGVHWDREMFQKWAAWTEEDFFVHEVESDHMGIKNARVMQAIVFKELAGFCGMTWQG